MKPEFRASAEQSWPPIPPPYAGASLKPLCAPMPLRVCAPNSPALRGGLIEAHVGTPVPPVRGRSIPPPYAGASLKRHGRADGVEARRAIPPPYAGASLKHAAVNAGQGLAAGQFPRPTRGPH